MPDNYPVYTLKPKLGRVMLPKIILLSALAILLYIGAVLNLRFLNVERTTMINISIMLVVFLLVAFDLLFEYRRALKLEYYFYREKLYANGNWLVYSAIQHIDAKRDFFDRFTKTCTLVVNNNVQLKHVPDSYNIYQYIQNLAQYSKGNPA